MNYKHNVYLALLEMNKSISIKTSQLHGRANGILFPKLLWPTVRKFFFSDLETLLKFKAEGQEFPNILRSLEQFIWTVKV